jgi:2',3'-cyclic-nucleotide 2'-phosphodiesterase (5'-nucleotidase family)
MTLILVRFPSQLSGLTPGFPHLTKLINSTTFPWLLSNIIDSDTNSVPEPLRRYWITERCGVKIGVVGLVEE